MARLVLKVEPSGDGRQILTVDAGVTTTITVVMPNDVFYAGAGEDAAAAILAHQSARLALLKGPPS